MESYTVEAQVVIYNPNRNQEHELVEVRFEISEVDLQEWHSLNHDGVWQKAFTAAQRYIENMSIPGEFCICEMRVQNQFGMLKEDVPCRVGITIANPDGSREFLASNHKNRKEFFQWLQSIEQDVIEHEYI
jgi:hypothetical protein